MNNNKLIAVGLMLTIGVFLAAGCLGGGQGNISEEGGEEIDYKNCGISKEPKNGERPKVQECFQPAYEQCKPAKIEIQNYKNQEIIYRVEGGTPENCEVTWEFKKSPESKEIEGKSITCTLNSNTEEFNSIPSKLQEGKCTGDTKAFKNYWGSGTEKVKNKSDIILQAIDCDPENDQVTIRNTGSGEISKEITIVPLEDYSKEIGKVKFNTAPNGGLEELEKATLETTADLKKGKKYTLIGDYVSNIVLNC